VSLRKLLVGLRPGRKKNATASDDLDRKSTIELLSLMRHETHRIEKSVYNDILIPKHDIYARKVETVSAIHALLESRGVREDEPTWVWSREIIAAFDSLEKDFIEPNSTEPSEFVPEKAGEFAAFCQGRRSVRVWADEQPDEAALRKIAEAMLDGARWAPSSGNRQPWRFRILTETDDKLSLQGLKERHTVEAPLLIFVGMDTRVYGALGPAERSIYIDAGAAVMQMVLVAHSAGLGVCWNHFADDLIQSRPANIERYQDFSRRMGIPDYVAPIAVVAIGAPAFVPPLVARTDVSDLMLE